MTSGHYDDAVVGAGIVGLAHAYHLAKRGRRVVVVERHERAQGASVRNFGMLWPVGQPWGGSRAMALRSRDVWLEVLDAAGLWHDRCGSLHLAYRDDEARVLREFVAREASRDPAFASGLTLLDPAGVAAVAPAARPDGLLLGMYSRWETCVDPREVIAGLPGWLAGAHGVGFTFGTAALGYDRPRLRTSAGSLDADRLWVCAGDELQTLYPEVLGPAGLSRCKLQMLRTEPAADSRRIGPMLAAGLTLRHYPSFEGCPSLPELRARVACETPEYDRFGVHVMASQNGKGELALGDSHEYGGDITPFDSAEIERLIMDYLHTFLKQEAIPAVAARWQGVYVKSPDGPAFVAFPGPGVTAVTGLGGAGMTLSFGLAGRVVAETLTRED